MHALLLRLKKTTNLLLNTPESCRRGMKATAASTPNTNHHILDLDPLRITGSKNYFVSTLHITIPQGKNIENIHAKIELRSETTKKKEEQALQKTRQRKETDFFNSLRHSPRSWEKGRRSSRNQVKHRGKTGCLIRLDIFRTTTSIPSS